MAKKMKHNKYTYNGRFGEAYIFYEYYLDVMIEAEKLTGINRYHWLHYFNGFIFDGLTPTFNSDVEKECWNKLMKELEDGTAKRGKYSTNWKGGISDENHLIRNSKEYQQWRVKVFTRDNFTCQLCNKVGGKLNAHHIKRFSKDKANRLNIANGITLCVERHKLVHKIEGR